MYLLKDGIDQQSFVLTVKDGRVNAIGRNRVPIVLDLVIQIPVSMCKILRIQISNMEKILMTI